MNKDKLREGLVAYLNKAHTHGTLADAVANFPQKFINGKPDGAPYTFWQLLYHINATQHDMIDFIQNPNYKELEWPKDYWPRPNQLGTKSLWDKALKQYEKDLQALAKLIKNPKTDLFAKIPHGTGQTIFQEYLQVIDHAAYHIGAFVVLRKTMGLWKK